jgi:dynein light chain 1
MLMCSKCNDEIEFLTILSLSRNSIKKIESLEPVAETLEELWLSYNQIERVNGVECCKKLKVLYLSNNKIKAWDGVEKLVRYTI